ncbi:MAG: ribosomal L7Ae/L30e/S12e/Gadd45 family protein [Bacillota bacterium]|nr:ribosomal L7Ae/L30e/S12e/Gadd45 family protein [Bacillota bacterium]
MIDTLLSKPHVVGIKQVKKVLRENRAEVIITAADAAPTVLMPAVNLAKEKGIPLVEVETMKKLGAACKIDVGAAVVAIIKE